MIKVLNYRIKDVKELDENIIIECEKKYVVNYSSLKFLHESIIETRTTHVFPTVFIKFFKYNFQIKNKVIYSDDDLFRLRVWSNVYKDEHHEECYNEKLLFLAMKIIDITEKSLKISNRRSFEKCSY
jgi:hypothetical protein